MCFARIAGFCEDVWCVVARHHTSGFFGPQCVELWFVLIMGSQDNGIWLFGPTLTGLLAFFLIGSARSGELVRSKALRLESANKGVLSYKFVAYYDSTECVGISPETLWRVLSSLKRYSWTQTYAI